MVKQSQSGSDQPSRDAAREKAERCGMTTTSSFGMKVRILRATPKFIGIASGKNDSGLPAQGLDLLHDGSKGLRPLMALRGRCGQHRQRPF
jgi:hypothetical protein